MNKMKYIKVTDKINDVETLFRLLLAGVPKKIYCRSNPI